MVSYDGVTPSTPFNVTGTATVVVDSLNNIFVTWHVAFYGGIFSRTKINGQWSSIYYHLYVGLAKQHHLALGPDIEFFPGC